MGLFFLKNLKMHFDLNVNEISKIIDLGSSFHILKLTEKNEFSITDEEIKEKIDFNEV